MFSLRSAARALLSLAAIALANHSPFAHAADEVAGMSQERMARIAPVMNEQIANEIFPGAVTLIARGGQVVHFEAHGFLDAGKTKPMTRDAIFRLASMTKPIVSVAAIMLIEQGAMKLNDPIVTWLPELKDLKVETQKTDKDGNVTTEDVPLHRPIWVQDLLRHTAGFVYARSTKSPRIAEMYKKANIEATETDIPGDAMLKALGTIPLAHQPGTFWEYSIAVDVLGLLLDRVAKKPLDQLLTELLFDPLGMKDTAFWVPKE
ncbi:MAG TPA: serine hydrolase domain-containing protein, partial [Hyphomicrobiaceae bacterium]|nr:serine hydrolase domain-containing protein [Hyphomicrobiaceae bacterium]